MKIIIATPLYPPEIEHLSAYSQELAEQLRSEHQVTVLAYANQVEPVSGVKILTVNKRQPLAIRILRYILQLWKASSGADIIYVQNAVACGLPAILIKILRKVPVVVNFSEDEAWKRALHLRLTDRSLEDFLKNSGNETKTRRLIKIQTRVLNQATKITVPSESLLKTVVENYKIFREKIIVNPNPTPKALLLPFEAKIIPQQIFINSKLFSWSGVDTLIKIVNQLKLDFPQIKLIIAGDGPDKIRLKQLVQEFGLSQQVVFLGRVSQAENQYLKQISQVVLEPTEEFSVEKIKTTLNSEKITPIKISWSSHLDKLNNIFNSVIKKDVS